MNSWLDEDGYPTQETLNLISVWDYKNIEKLFKFIKDIWTYKSYIFNEEYRWTLSTAGWSGNEDIIEALRKNRMVWLLTWESSRRGGHYIFDLSRAPKRNV